MDLVATNSGYTVFFDWVGIRTGFIFIRR